MPPALPTVLPVLSSLVSIPQISVVIRLLTILLEGNKSATQKAGDATRGGSDEGKGVLANAQESLGNAAQSVQDTLSGNKK